MDPYSVLTWINFDLFEMFAAYQIYLKKKSYEMCKYTGQQLIEKENCQKTKGRLKITFRIDIVESYSLTLCTEIKGFAQGCENTLNYPQFC